jgi:hypothetical protein
MTNGEKAVVRELLQRDEAKGATVHVRLASSSFPAAPALLQKAYQSPPYAYVCADIQAFNPDADPAQKAALAGAAKAQLDALPTLGRRKAIEEANAGLALGVDTSGVDGQGVMPVPTVTVSDADAVSRGEGQIAGLDAMPGSIPTGAAPAVPTWVSLDMVGS